MAESAAASANLRLTNEDRRSVFSVGNVSTTVTAETAVMVAHLHKTIHKKMKRRILISWQISKKIAGHNPTKWRRGALPTGNRWNNLLRPFYGAETWTLMTRQTRANPEPQHSHVLHEFVHGTSFAFAGFQRIAFIGLGR